MHQSPKRATQSAASNLCFGLFYKESTLPPKPYYTYLDQFLNFKNIQFDDYKILVTNRLWWIIFKDLGQRLASNACEE